VGVNKKMKKASLFLDSDDVPSCAMLELLRRIGFEVKKIPVNDKTLPNLPYLLVGEKEYHGMREIGKFIREEREKNRREESRLR
jgi:hypothetical protein